MPNQTPSLNSKSYKPIHGGRSFLVYPFSAAHSYTRDLDIKCYGKYYEATFHGVTLGRFLNKGWIKANQASELPSKKCEE